jgi:hypothetical protein
MSKEHKISTYLVHIAMISDGLEALKPSELNERNNLLHEMKHQKSPKFKTPL